MSGSALPPFPRIRWQHLHGRRREHRRSSHERRATVPRPARSYFRYPARADVKSPKRSRTGSRQPTDFGSPRCSLTSRIPRRTATGPGSTGSSPRSAGVGAGRCGHLDVYRNADPEEDFGHFKDPRETDIELLRSCPPKPVPVRRLYRSTSEITLSRLLHEWALHDIGHGRQIGELVRQGSISRAPAHWGKSTS